jgi:IS1 family transposase
MSNMNRLDMNRRVLVVKALCEGMGLRATSRLTGVARMTVEKLQRELGAACATYMDRTLMNLTCKRVQCDETWAFCYAKARTIKNDPTILERNPNAGDVWTWAAIDPDSKLIVSFFVGPRDYSSAMEFMRDVSSRLANRVQLTTDGLRYYLRAVDYAFGTDVDFAQLVKYYGEDPQNEKRYSPAICTGCEKIEVTGSPDPAHISTSMIERSNLTMRMHMRRFTRLTNGHSKKLEMHMAAVALHFAYYNFAKIHETLRQTPAMAAGVSTKVWEIEDIIHLLDS